MSYSLYRIEFKKVVDLTEDEVNIIEANAQPFDEPARELFLTVFFDDDDEEMVERANELKKKLRPEVFEAVKSISLGSETFLIA